MDYAEARAEARRSDTNQELHDFSWEQEHIPVLHSGFLQPQTGDDTKSRLVISIWFTKGAYRAVLTDKENGEKAFIELGAFMSGIVFLEKCLKDGRLDWEPERFKT